MKGVYSDLQFDQYCQKLSGLCPSEVAAKDFKLLLFVSIACISIGNKSILGKHKPLSPCFSLCTLHLIMSSILFP